MIASAPETTAPRRLAGLVECLEGADTGPVYPSHLPAPGPSRTRSGAQQKCLCRAPALGFFRAHG